MSDDLVLHYRLPLSRLLVCGVLRRSVDRALQPDADLARVAAQLVSYSIEPTTVADGTELTAHLGRSWLFATKNTFSLTSDGRLSSASVESTGQLGEVAAAAGQLLGAAAAVALGDAPDPHFIAYEVIHPASAARITRLRQALAALGAALDAEYTAATENTDPGNARTSGRIARLERLVEGLERRLAAAEAPFEAWMSQQVVTVDTYFSFVVELADIPGSAPQAAPRPADTFTPPVDLDTLWSEYGVTVVARWQSVRATKAWSRPAQPTERRKAAQARRTLYARCADTVELDTVCCLQGVTTVKTTTRADVADSYSTHREIPLRRSLFGRRSVGVLFSAEGFLTGLSSEGDAALGRAAHAAAALPGSVQTGLEGVTKLRTASAAARRATIDSQLAATKAALDLEQARTSLTGAQLTSQDAARLARLTQLKAIYESQLALTGPDPDLTAWARGQVELLGTADEPTLRR